MYYEYVLVCVANRSVLEPQVFGFVCIYSRAFIDSLASCWRRCLAATPFRGAAHCGARSEFVALALVVRGLRLHAGLYLR